MAARWGKTSGAYKKFERIFSRSLPVTVPSNAPISDAGFLRDVLAYAHEHGLAGATWYKKVTVSPQEDNCVIIKAKPMFAEELSAAILPELSILEILKKIEDGDIVAGYQCTLEEPYDEVAEVVDGFDFSLRKLGGMNVEFKRSK